MSYADVYTGRSMAAERVHIVGGIHKEALQAQSDKTGVWSVRPRFPKDLTYIGSVYTSYGRNDYYQDEDGMYWYEGRKKNERVILSFILPGKDKKRRE